MTRPTRRLPRLAAIMAVTLLGVLAALPAQAAQPRWDPITGTGSTWSQNALDQWRANASVNYQMTVNYSGVGSSAGRRDFIAGSIDYAVSEIPFELHPDDGSTPEVPPRGFAYMPIVAGGTAFMYHLTIGGKRVNNLRLSGETITKIFTGAITNWSDPAVQADNPGLAMPNTGIVPVVRSDGSGSTAQFTSWMAAQHSALWNTFCTAVGRTSPCGMTSQYPIFGTAKGQNGSSGVAGYVSQGYGEGAITYVEYSYALESGFPVAKVLNSADYYVEPTRDSVAVALMKAKINTDPAPDKYLTQILDGVYNNADPRTYPLSSYSYMIVPTEVKPPAVFTASKGATLGRFANYMLCEGQQQAGDLGYSPLPMNLVLAGFEQIKRIPGAGEWGTMPSDCNNPTFKPGESPDANQLALTAAQPAACDKRGPEQCKESTGGAPDATTDSATNDDTTDTAGAGGDAVAYDENGNPISGANAGGRAVASPFTLESEGWGWQQSAMLGAVGLLLAAVMLPPFVLPRLRRADGSDTKTGTQR